MKILNFGSMNLDYVYSVQEIVRTGETVRALSRKVCCGGKGLNQSIALSKAGAPVWQGGLLGEDGGPLRAALEESGVHTELIRGVAGPSSHTVIQVDEKGRNCILFYAHEGLRVTDELIAETLAPFGPEDWLLLQNELDNAAQMIREAKARGMKVILNPSPANEDLLSVPLGLVDCFLLNEHEGAFLAGEEDPSRVLSALHGKFPQALIVLTLGEKGSVCLADGVRYEQGIFPVQAVDTTAAGDTFTGYFLAGLLEGREIPQCLRRAAMASSIAVSRPGAADSIPLPAEVEQALAAAE